MAVTVTMILAITDCSLCARHGAKCRMFSLCSVTHYRELGVIVTRPTLQKSSLRLGIARSWPGVIQASVWYSQSSGVSACRIRTRIAMGRALYHGGRAKVR